MARGRGKRVRSESCGVKETGGPAFPLSGDIPVHNMDEQKGMTLRDYFAGQALAGLSRGVGLDLERHDLARRSYTIADAMLAERVKP